MKLDGGKCIVNPLLNFWTILEPVCSFKEFAQETPVTAHPSDFAQASRFGSDDFPNSKGCFFVVAC